MWMNFRATTSSALPKDLKSLEGMFLDTIETVGRHGNETASKIAKDFLAHARANGTEVGRQSRLILEGTR